MSCEQNLRRFLWTTQSHRDALLHRRCCSRQPPPLLPIWPLSDRASLARRSDILKACPSACAQRTRNSGTAPPQTQRGAFDNGSEKSCQNHGGVSFFLEAPPQKKERKMSAFLLSISILTPSKEGVPSHTIWPVSRLRLASATKVSTAKIRCSRRTWLQHL